MDQLEVNSRGGISMLRTGRWGCCSTGLEPKQVAAVAVLHQRCNRSTSNQRKDMWGLQHLTKSNTNQTQIQHKSNTNQTQILPNIPKSRFESCWVQIANGSKWPRYCDIFEAGPKVGLQREAARNSWPTSERSTTMQEKQRVKTRSLMITDDYWWLLMITDDYWWSKRLLMIKPITDDYWSLWLSKIFQVVWPFFATLSNVQACLSNLTQKLLEAEMRWMWS